MSLYKLFAPALLLWIFTAAGAQDLHFSQYYNNPLLVNPASTGFAPEADWRAGVSYRNQWANLMTNPYRTFSAWGDVQLFNDRFENGWVGVGGMLMTDKAGSGNLTSTRAQLSLAYHQLLGPNSLISMGFQGGYNQKRIDFSKLNFDNQWNGQFFDTNIPSNESFGSGSFSYFNLNAGINYALFPSDNLWVNVGVAASNINRPKERFLFAGSVINDNRTPVRISGFADATIRLSNKVIINPNLYYSYAATSQELLAGMNARYNLSGDGATQLIGGVYYRLGDAIIPMVGFQMAEYSLTVNYDVTASPAGSFNARQGAYEFSIVKKGLYSTGKSVKCPPVSF